MAPQVLIVGIGNQYRHDDGVGPLIARALRARHLPGVRVLEHGGEGASLMAMWQDASCVILLDAVVGGGAPGTICQLDAAVHPIPQDLLCASTHAFGVAQAIELARALGELPGNLMVYAIEGRDFTPGIGLTPEVEAAVRQVIQRVTDRITDSVPEVQRAPANSRSLEG
jgi:hydrogenase maturation protease